MDRRTYLGALGTTGLTSIAGCLGETLGGGGNDGNANTVLSPPDGKRGSSEYDPLYPHYGEEFPSFSLQDPLAGETVTRDDFVGERSFLMTFIYTSCPDGACPTLLQYLRRVQQDAAERGYEDDVALLAVTFDPERDTAAALRSFGSQVGVDYEAENWHFLRPESYEAAKSLMQNTFGVPIEKTDGTPSQRGTANQTDSTNQTGSSTHEHNESNQTGSTGHDHGEYMFMHTSLVELVNDQGIVERAYPKANVQREGINAQVIVEDTRTVVGVDG